jgi:diamine N-acetyltransferase
VGAVATHASQERFVAPMAVSFRDALVPPVRAGLPSVPWYRAIEADGDVVGFLLAAARTADRPNPYLWRLLVDRMHQRRGIGSAVLDRFEQWCRDQGATAVEVDWRDGPGSPAPLGLARGYAPTSRRDDGATHAVKRLG